MSRKIALLLNKLTTLDPTSPEFIETTKQVVTIHKEAVKEREERELKKALEPQEPKPKKKINVICGKCKDQLVDEDLRCGKCQNEDKQPKEDKPKVVKPKKEKKQKVEELKT